MPNTVNTVWFVAGSSGTADFSDGTAFTGYRNLAGGSLVNGAVYSYRAEHPTDKSIWENGSGAVNTGTNVLARTTIAESLTGSKINFAVPPVVILDLMKRDLDLVPHVDVAQQFTEAQMEQVRANVYAAPFDALAYNGMQINGSMEVSQENGTTAVALATGTASYVIDGWQGKFVRAATLAISCQQVTPPGSPSFQSALQNALQIKATTGLTPLAIGDYGYLEHLIEGYRTSRLSFGASSAQSVSIGFWVYATIAGTMTVTLLNSAANRAIPVNIVINSATTWEYKTVTFAGDTSGTWLFTTGIGLRARFCFGAGSTFQGTNNTWTGSEVFATSATTNFFASTNNLACVTGVVVLPGIELPSSTRAPHIMRPFDQELAACLRHYEKSYDYGTALGTVTGNNNFFEYQVNVVSTTTAKGSKIIYTVRKRASPTVVFYSPTTGASGKLVDDSGGVDVNASSAYGSETGITAYASFAATATISMRGHWTAAARL